MKTLLAFAVIFMMVVKLIGEPIPSPNSKKSAQPLLDTKGQVCGVEIIGKTLKNKVQFQWDWSQEVAVQWLSNELLIMYQNNGYNGVDHHYNGLIALVDVPSSSLVFLDYVEAAFLNSSGNTMCYLSKIGKKIKVEDYAHKINFLDIQQILDGKAKSMLPWFERQELINQGKYDFKRLETPALLTINPQKLGFPQGSKTFLLAPPVLGAHETFCLVALGSSIHDVKSACIVSRAGGTSQFKKFDVTLPVSFGNTELLARSLYDPFLKLVPVDLKAGIFGVDLLRPIE